MTRPADVGMQAERTSLAWRRTALSVTVGSLAGLRVLPPQLGAIGYAVSTLGLVWGLDLALTARRRYRDGARLVRAGAGTTSAGPSVVRAVLTAGVFGVVALATVVVIALR